MPVYKDEKGRGTWYVSLRYMDWTGARKTHKKRGFPTKREAQEYERNFLTKDHKAKGYTVKMLYEDYRKDFAERLRPSTIVSRDYMFRKHIEPFFGDMEIVNVTPAIVRNWLMGRRKYLAPSSVSVLKAMVSSMFNFAIVYYGHSYNPFSVVRPPDKVEKRATQIWTPQEFEQVVQYASSKYKPLLYFLFYSGARIGEALALTFGDIEGNTVHINKTMSVATKDLIPAPPKTRTSVRDIALPRFVMDMIKPPYNVQSTDRVYPIHREAVRRALGIAAKKAGIPRIRLHDLRHSHASYLMAHFPIPAVSKRLGHANSQITMSTYAHAMPSDVDAICDFLEKERDT